MAHAQRDVPTRGCFPALPDPVLKLTEEGAKRDVGNSTRG